MTRFEPPFRPLREDDSLEDRELRLGADILMRVGPLSRSELRRRRVWQALAAGGGSRLGARAPAMRVAVTAVLFAAASSAAVGHYYAKQAPLKAEVAPPRVAAPVPPARARTQAPRRAPQEPLVEAAPPAPATPLKPVVPAPRSRSDAAHPSRASSEADARLLVEAMRARRGGDAARVSQLAEEYRLKHPQGALQEEALILSVESAAARHAPNAGALAREYLNRFPSGRFVAQAKRALSTASP